MKAWESNIRKVEPYVPGEQPKVQDVIKLNTNENPYGPSENVRKAMEAIDIDRCRLYPDPDVTKLVKSIADYYGMDNNQVLSVWAQMMCYQCVSLHFLMERSRYYSRILHILFIVYGLICTVYHMRSRSLMII